MSQHSSDPSCCSRSEHLESESASAELKLYRAFIFSVPIFFTFILLLLFYVFYLRPRRVNWSSLRMRAFAEEHAGISRPELGLKKELREMLPIIVYKESFSVKDTLCSVCLLDYQPEERLQQIPACGHTFHMNCIDLWLTNHSTCPLCRLSVLTSAKSSTETSNIQAERPPDDEETPTTQLPETTRSTGHTDTGVVQNCSGDVAIASSIHCLNIEREGESG